MREALQAVILLSVKRKLLHNLGKHVLVYIYHISMYIYIYIINDTYFGA